jgi:hypothetical protein
MSNLFRATAVLCATFLLNGCFLLPWIPPKADPRLAEVLYGDGDIAFLSYPFETQFDLYQYAKRYVRPYSGELAYYIASNGSTIVPFLSEKFKTAKDARVQEDVMFVFAVMTAKKFYDAGQNPELVAMMQPAVISMRPGLLRDDAEWEMEIITSRVSDKRKPEFASVAGMTVATPPLHKQLVGDRPQQ